jgi:hypothetical protein
MLVRKKTQLAMDIQVSKKVFAAGRVPVFASKCLFLKEEAMPL